MILLPTTNSKLKVFQKSLLIGYRFLVMKILCSAHNKTLFIMHFNSYEETGVSFKIGLNRKFQLGKKLTPLINLFNEKLSSVEF